MAKLIHIVGPSGSGKTTVHGLLNERIRGEGFKVEALIEPGPLREQILAYRRRNDRNPWTEAALFTTDRLLLYQEKVLPHMDEPDLVFTFARGYPDTLVYQGIRKGVPFDVLQRMNSFLPSSDLYLTLLVQGNTGYERILKRHRETGERISSNENPENIEKLSEGYESLKSHFPQMVIIETTPLSPEEVLERCWEEARKVLPHERKDC